MSRPVADLQPHLSNRAFNALTRSSWDRMGKLERGLYQTIEQVAEASDADLLDLRHLGPHCLAEIRAAVRTVLGERPTPHRPVRGSDVEAWIQQAREAHEPGSGDEAQTRAYEVLDDLLNDYCRRADQGLPLGQDVA